MFDDGYDVIEARTGWRGFGVLPWFADAWKLPAEDALDIAKHVGKGAFKIVCLGLSRIANFDDLDPLAQEPGVAVQMLLPGQAIAGDTDLVIIPGSKSTRGDLAFLRAQGWDVDLMAHRRRGGFILGICGGYQMLGKSIVDADGIEGAAGESEGLGLLDVVTEMVADKKLSQITAMHAGSGQVFEGYEIHIGRTDGADCARPFASIGNRSEGAISPDGKVIGSYLHGMFRNDTFRSAFLRGLGAEASGVSYDATVEATLDALADHIEAHLDVDALLSAAR
ncbi:MAG: adenosylcobyric acid synthase [Paracoccaceae bacterium]